MRYLLSSLNMKQSICYFIAIVIKYSDNDSDSYIILDGLEGDTRIYC